MFIYNPVEIPRHSEGGASRHILKSLSILDGGTMDETEVERFREQLVRMKSELEEMTQSSSDELEPVALDQTSVGRLSRIDAMQAQQMAQAAARRRSQQLLAVAAALRRIEAGDYGECIQCGEEIDVRRLTVNPAAACCITCANN
jgi:DnaK suppressor protein